MGIVKHQSFSKELAAISADQLPNLFLICGEPFLVKKAFAELTRVLTREKNEFSIEKLDGAAASVGDIIEQVTTFSFLSAKKIVAVTHIPLFQPDVNPSAIKYGETEYAALTRLIENKWPKEHILVLTAGQGDRRKKIFKTIDNHGMIIDCSVPKGARKVDQDEQRTILKNVAGQVLRKFSKTLNDQAFQTLLGLTGFNLDSFVLNLEKLSVYTSDRPQITMDDVKAVVIRDKKDPIFNLTNAVMDKKANSALTTLNALFEEGYHPLQIMKSFENLIRKLILVRDFLAMMYPKGANIRQMSFNQFKQALLPRIVDLDEKRLKQIQDQEQVLTGKEMKKKDIPKDLFLAPNPKNAYPVYQTFLKSENFSLDELCMTLVFLSDLDFDLKTSSIDAKTQIENLIIKLCSKGGFTYAEENQDRRHNL